MVLCWLDAHLCLLIRQLDGHACLLFPNLTQKRYFPLCFCRKSQSLDVHFFFLQKNTQRCGHLLNVHAAISLTYRFGPGCCSHRKHTTKMVLQTYSSWEPACVHQINLLNLPLFLNCLALSIRLLLLCLLSFLLLVWLLFILPCCCGQWEGSPPRL